MVGRKSWFFVWNAYVKSDTPSEFRDGISYGKKLESRNHEKKKMMGAGRREVNDVWRHDLVMSVEYTNDSRCPASHTPRHGVGRSYA